MKICFFRSSSYNTDEWCSQKYFLEYDLGWTFQVGAAADKGTIFHKTMEILAMIKKARQDGAKDFTDDETGEYKVPQRVNVYKILERVFNYYTEKLPHQEFGPKDLKEIRSWVDMIKNFRDGLYYPLNQEIFKAEQSFNFAIEQPWAKYNYIHNGQQIDGYLGLKGTIDLMIKVDDETLHIIDYKTGKTKMDWATGQEKTYDKLMNDPQLRIYHYAASYLYPEYENIMVTIYFVRCGGPYTLCFSPHHLAETEGMLKKKFDKIRTTKIPRLTKTWKCSRFCPYSKNTFKDPLVEFRGGQFTAPGQPMSMCQQAEYMVKQKGLDWVEENYSAPGHELTYYKAPGSVK